MTQSAEKTLPENLLRKGDFALVHIQSSGYSLVAGTFHYSRYFVARIEKATREGWAKAFTTWQGQSPRVVDRKTTVYASVTGFHQATLGRAYAAQTIEFQGYHTKEELRAALNAACGAA